MYTDISCVFYYVIADNNIVSYCIYGIIFFVAAFSHANY